MKFLLPALALFIQSPQPDAEGEAAALVQAVAEAYELHAEAAAELERMGAAIRFRQEFVDRHESDEETGRAFVDILWAGEEGERGQARQRRATDIAAAIDFDTLLDTTPGAAWLAIEILRRSGEGETRATMLSLLDGLARQGGYQSDYYAMQVAGYTPAGEDGAETEEAPPPTPPGAEARAAAQRLAEAYRRDRQTWWPIVAAIAEMRGREQYVRWLLIEVLARDLDPQVREIYQERIDDVLAPVDTANTERVLEIFETVDFAELNSVSPYAAEEAIGILHHSNDLGVMKQTLALIEPAALAGEFRRQRYALLYDRVAMNEGRPQRYGSQGTCIDGRQDIYEIENPETVDERRAEMGLEPLADYRASLIEMYGPDC